MSDERVILIDLGIVAYEAYRAAAEGRSLVTGAALPEWHDQSAQIRECWRAAADGVRMWLELHPPTRLMELHPRIETVSHVICGTCTESDRGHQLYPCATLRAFGFAGDHR